jgi:hypothetical protein
LIRRVRLAAVVAALAAGPIGPTAAAAPVFEAPVVLEQDGGACYRIPSLARVQSGYVLVAERRFGIDGRMLCNDDGDTELVARRSPDGITWSRTGTVVDHAGLVRAMADPTGPVHDPDFAALEPADRFVRIGNQSLAGAGDSLLVVFEVRYNIVADCGDRAGCLNSPENVFAGTARSRFFSVSSADGGLSWSRPRRIHSEVYRSCIDRLVRDADLRAALHRVFADESVGNETVRSNRRALQPKSGAGGTGRFDPAAAAQLLGVPADAVAAERAAVRSILNPQVRVGPGNAAVFPYSGVTRVFAPGAPLGFFSDDFGASWTCSDTVAVNRGSERQVAALADGTLVMTLRERGGVAGAGDRLFAVSLDGGASFRADAPVPGERARFFPDAVAQGAILGLQGRNGPLAVVSSVTGVEMTPALADRLAEDEHRVRHPDAATAEERSERRARIGRGDRRNDLGHVEQMLARRAGEIEQSVERDPRVRLSLSTIAVHGGSVTSTYRAGSGGCDLGLPVRADTVLWPFSAAYSAMVLDPSGTRIAIAFEAADDRGPLIERRSWNESIRFAFVPVSRLEGTPVRPTCR